MSRAGQLVKWLTGDSSGNVTAKNTPSSTDNSKKLATTEWALLGFAASITQNGYIKFPTWLGGLIIQWGNTPSVAAGAQATVTLPIPMPGAILQFVATGASNGNTTTAAALTVERNGTSKTDFIIRNWGPNLLAAGSWIAIGN